MSMFEDLGYVRGWECATCGGTDTELSLTTDGVFYQYWKGCQGCREQDNPRWQGSASPLEDWEWDRVFDKLEARGGVWISYEEMHGRKAPRPD
jgi:hypothetical protein